MTTIVPAIDIIEGKCVRLCQGDYSRSKVYSGSPEDSAKAFADAGVRRIHLVDLEGAKVSSPRNLLSLERIARATDGVRLEWGGGLKTESDLHSAYDAGCTDAVIGSTAVREPELFRKWLEKFGGEAVVLGADVREGFVAVNGWQENSSVRIEELVEKFADSGLTQCIVTEISHDGMLQGPATELYEGLLSKWPSIAWTASGGVSSMKDIEALSKAGIPRAIVGKAFYEGRITLKDIEKWSRKE